MKKEELILNGINVKIFQQKKDVQHVLIAIHGFAGDSDSSVIYEIAKKITNDCKIVTFDLPNHGKNEDKDILDLNKCLMSIKMIDEYVKEKFKGKKISYFATSFGAYLLLSFLNDIKYKYYKIILRAPAIYMDEILKNVIIPEHGYDFDELGENIFDLGYNKQLLINMKFYEDLKKNKLDNKNNIDRYLYVIQGKKDDVVDYRKNEDFFKDKNTDKNKFYYFENADHRFKNDGELDKIVEIVREILIG